MGIARSTYYDQITVGVDDTELVEIEAYGYRRMQAALR